MNRTGFALALSLLMLGACGSPGKEPSKSTFDQTLRDNATLASEVERLRTHRAQITGELDVNNEKVADLQAKMLELEQSGASKEGLIQSKINQEQLKLGNLGAKVASVEGSIAGTLDPAEEQALMSELATAQAAYNQQAAKLTDLNNQLLAAQKTQTEMAEKFAQELAAAQKAYDAQTAKLNAMEEENGRLTQELGQVQEANRKLMAEADELRTKNTELQTALAMAQTRIQELEACMAALQMRYTELKGSFDQSQAELSSTKNALASSQAKANALQAQLDQLKVKYTQLESQNRALQAEANAAKADAAKARQEAAYAKAEADRAKAAAAQAQAQAQAAVARAQAAQAAAQQANSAVVGNPSFYPKCPARYYGAAFGCGAKQCAKSDPGYQNICEI